MFEMIEATEIVEVLETAKSASSLPPGLPASEYLSGELWEFSDQTELLFAQRKRFLAEIGFCLVTAEVIDALATLLAGKKVLDAGSGSGWLAARLGERGINVLAADWTDYRTADRSSKRGYPIREVFRLDHRGNAVDLLPGDYDTVLLVWPNYETQFAKNVACAMRSGQALIYEGESEGGCTADQKFFQHLRNSFNPGVSEMDRLNKNHRTFPGLHDKWWIGTKR
jgi:SAM-dependent methyltransferase